MSFRTNSHSARYFAETSFSNDSLIISHYISPTEKSVLLESIIRM